MPRPKIQPPTCEIDGCERATYARGMCSTHYQRHRKYGRFHKVYTGDKRSHPLYSVWFERKQRGSLCDAWASDFAAFVEGVGERPSPTHLLRPRRYGEPYGPDNFEWLAALKREEGESRKAFNARKWASRRERFPTYEAHRNILRKYGLTQEQFREMLQAQGGLCAICRQPETRLHPKTHAPHALAVDHCHEKGHVRGLLCWRCNTSIGKFEHDPVLLERAAAFCRGEIVYVGDVL